MNHPARPYRKKLKNKLKPGDLIVLKSADDELGTATHRNSWILIRRVHESQLSGDENIMKNRKRSKWSRQKRLFWITYNTREQAEEVHYEKSLRHKLLKFPSLWSHVSRSKKK